MFCHFCGQELSRSTANLVILTDEEDIDFIGRGHTHIWVCKDEAACKARREAAKAAREAERREMEELKQKEAAELDRLLCGLVRVMPFEFDRRPSWKVLNGADVFVGTVGGQPAVAVSYSYDNTFYYATPGTPGVVERDPKSTLDFFFGD